MNRCKMEDIIERYREHRRDFLTLCGEADGMHVGHKEL